MEEARPDDNETRVSGVRQAHVNGESAWMPQVEDLALPKSLSNGNFILAKAAIRRFKIQVKGETGS